MTTMLLIDRPCLLYVCIKCPAHSNLIRYYPEAICRPFPILAIPNFICNVHFITCNTEVFFQYQGTDVYMLAG